MENKKKLFVPQILHFFVFAPHKIQLRNLNSGFGFLKLLLHKITRCIFFISPTKE